MESALSTVTGAMGARFGQEAFEPVAPGLAASGMRKWVAEERRICELAPGCVARHHMPLKLGERGGVEIGMSIGLIAGFGPAVDPNLQHSIHFRRR